MKRSVGFLFLVLAAVAVMAFFACGGKLAPLEEEPPLGAGTSTAPPSSSTPEDDAGGHPIGRDAGGDGSDGGGGGGEDAGDLGDVVKIPLPPLDANVLPQCVDYVHDADPGAPSSVYPAFQTPMPEILSAGGPIVGPTPTLVPVTWTSDPTAATKVDFVQRLGASQWWSAITTDYGINAPNVIPGQVVEPPLNAYLDGQIVELLYAKATGPSPVLPPPTPSTLYVVFLPPGITTNTYDPKSPEGCPTYHYHYEPKNKPPISYAVVTHCGSYAGFTGLDAVTARASRVIIGGVADPKPKDDPGLAAVDSDHYMRQYVWGSWYSVEPVAEPTDLCSTGLWHNVHDPITFQPPDLTPYWIERVWSNSASLAHHAPCGPPTEAYFAATAVTKDKVSGAINPGDFGNGVRYFHTTGLVVPPGSCRTLEIDVQSDRDLGEPVLLDAFETTSMYPRCMGNCNNGPSARAFWDKREAVNGEKRYLTVEVYANKGDGYSAIMLSATAQGRSIYWPVVLGYAPDK